MDDKEMNSKFGTKGSYYFSESELLSCICQDCNFYNDDIAEDEELQCEKCQSDNVILETTHEHMNCDNCNKLFDMWESGYQSNGKDDFLLCEDCYSKL